MMAGVRSLPPGAPGDPALEATAFLRAFRRRWVAAVGLGLICALGAAAAAWYLLPPAKYTASALLEIKSVRPRIIFPLQDAETDFYTYQKTQIAWLLSRKILGEALLDPEVALCRTVAEVREKEDPVDWLSRELQVQTSSPEILTVSLSGSRPEDLAVIVNGVIDVYMKHAVEVERESRQKRLQYLESLYETFQEDLRIKREALRAAAMNAGSSDRQTLALKQGYALQNLAAARQMQTEVRFEIMSAEADLKILEAKGPAEIGGVGDAGTRTGAASPEELERRDPTIASLLEQLAKKQQQIGHYGRSVIAKDSDPVMRGLYAERGQLQRALDAQRQRFRAALAAEAGRGGGQAPAGSSPNPVADARERLAKWNLFDQSLRQDIERYEEEARTTNIRALDLQTEQEAVQLAAETGTSVGKEIQALKIEMDAPKRIEIVDRAWAPQTRDDAKKVKLTGMAGCGAFGLVVAGITLLELRARRITSIDEVVHALGLKLVGALPSMPTRVQGRAVGRGGSRWAQQGSRLVESIDATRTMLLHASRAESIRAVMVASAMPGEGKTSLACHLAASLARAGRKTLLIDGDLRKPGIQRIFDLPLGPGLCDLLRGEAEPRAVIQETSAEDLHIITAGQFDPLSLQALAQDDARAIFDALLEQYDFLIVDSAPLLPVTDPLLLAQQIDAVLFSVLNNVSCMPHVRAAYDRLAGLNVRVLGAVVAGTRAGHSYAYPGGYGDYPGPVCSARSMS